MTIQTNALAVRSQDSLAPMSWQDTFSLAQVLCKSGMIPVKTPEAAVATILKGREVGFGPMESFEFISVIQGRPTINPKGQLAQIYRSQCLDGISIQDDGETCTVMMRRKGGATHTATFSNADAKAAGLLGNDNWKKYPKQMRQWRAVGYCADVLFPDLTGGSYRPEEFGAVVDAEGCLVEHDPRTGEVAPRIEQPKPKTNGHASREELAALAADLKSLGQTTPEQMRHFLSGALGRQVNSATELTPDEIVYVRTLARETRENAAPEVVDAEHVTLEEQTLIGL